MNDQSKNIITTETAAKLLMVTPEWVRRLTKDGAIKKLGKDRYDVVAVVQGYITFLKDEQRKATKSAAASRVQDARAQEIEFRVARERGQVIPVADVVEFLTDTVGAFRSELAGLAAACTRELEQRAVIESNVNASIDRLRTLFDAGIASFKDGKSPDVGGEEADT